MDSFNDLISITQTLRRNYECADDIVIYTGYTEEECNKNGWIQKLAKFENIIVKFGRFIPDQRSHYDEILGVNLASENQYAVKI